jgi:hypothetical protein
MGNKSKKKNNKPKKVAAQEGTVLTQEQKVAATRRLVTLFKTISEPPEPLLTLFARLEMPWSRMTFDGKECYVITVEDFEAGESRNQAQGSLANRVYNDADQHNDSVSDSSNDSGADDDSVDSSDADIQFTEPAVEVVAAQEDSDEYADYIRGAQG